MGGPIGRHLLAAGTPLAVFDPSDEARSTLVRLGASECTSAADVAGRSELVLVAVVDDAQVRDAVAGCFEGAGPGTVIAICASVRPDTCRELARAGAGRDVDVIDAALVRGERGAEEGRLVLFCGGPVEVIDRIAPTWRRSASAAPWVSSRRSSARRWRSAAARTARWRSGGSTGCCGRRRTWRSRWRSPPTPAWRFRSCPSSR